MDKYPLLQAQTAIYYEWVRDPKSTKYNLPFIHRIKSEYTEQNLEDAILKIADAHPMLYIRYGLDEQGNLYQYTDKQNFQINKINTKESEIDALKTQLVRPFDLLAESPVRFYIIKTEAHIYLFSDIHHISYDGTSSYVLHKALQEIMSDEKLSGEHITLLDYALEEHEKRQTADAIQADLNYFTELLSDASSEGVPQKTEISTNAAGVYETKINNELLQEVCKQHDIAMSSVFIFALSLVLSRYSRTEKPMFGIVNHGRGKQELKNSIGAFIRTLPFAVQIDKDENTINAIKKNKDITKELWRHQTAAFGEIIKHTGKSFEITFNYMKFYTVDLSIAEYSERIAIKEATLDLAVEITEQDNNTTISIQYNQGKYYEKDINVFAKAYLNCILDIANNPQKKCSEISLISQEEQQLLFAMGKGEELDYNKNETIIDLFKRQAVATPDATAVVYNNKLLKYKELDEITTRLAKYLVSKGVKPETAVGVMIDRSDLMVIYPLAIMKAGAAYMPLDYSFPSDRLAFMIQDANVSIILSEGDRVAKALPDFDGFVFLSEDLDSLPNIPDIELSMPKPENMYVVLYTSGSTGTPKGCILEHRNIVNFCYWHNKVFSITASDRSVAYANFGFDAHMIDIYPLLISGGSVYIIPSSMRMNLMELNQYIEDNHLTVAFLTTQIGMQFVQMFDNKSLRTLSVGGEKLQAVSKPHYDFYNVYGPTECTLYSTYYPIESDYSSSIIGRPLANYQLYVLDKYLNLLPCGVPGELCVGGVGVGRGYLNRPELTQEKFINWNGQKLYRTGDLVRWTDSGDIEYFSRMDNQVKLRGLRIELGEIETKIAAFSGISSTVVEVKEIGGTQHLVAYYSASSPIDIEALKTYLLGALTEFMVPSFFVQLDAFPLTPNGKVNRKALPLPEAKADEIIPPETENELKLYNLLTTLLNTSNFGITSNLMTIGMTSLLAIKFSVGLQQKHGWKLSVKDIISTPTIKKLATLIKVDEEKINVYPLREHYPITENQRGLYVDWLRNSDTIQYNIPMAVRFENIDPSRLENAVKAVFEAHPYLKAQLAQRGDDIVQLRRDTEPLIVNLTKTAAELDNNFFQSRVKPFDLLNDNLYRIEIYQTPKYVYLFIDIHHIIYDGASMSILLDELQKAYSGEKLKEEHYTAFDRAIDEELLMKSLKFSEAEKYFDNLLVGYESTVYPQSKKIDENSYKQNLNINIPREEITKFCRENGITENNFFLTVISETLSRITREENILISTVSSGRADNNLNGLIGMFVKTLPAVYQSKSLTVSEAMRQVQQQNIETIERDFYPFTVLTERHHIKPQILYAYQSGVGGKISIDDIEGTNIPLEIDTVKVPISILITPHEKEYAMELVYDSAIYSSDDIHTLGQMVSNFAQNCLDVQTNIHAVKNVNLQDELALIELGRGEALDYNKNETIIDLFNRQVSSYPNNIAVVDEVSSISYRVIDTYSNQLADKLLKFGLGAESYVAIMLPRCKEFTISVLATFKSGAAYLPLDSDYPNDRLVYMLEDSKAKVLITTRKLFNEKQETGEFEAENILFIDEFEFNNDDASPINNTKPQSLAYMIYTSGSTGKPKGVMIRHKSLLSFLMWRITVLKLNSDSRLALHSSFSFDASLDDLLTPLVVGGQTHIISSTLRMDIIAFRDYIINHGITGMTLSTQFGIALLNSADTPLPLSYLMMGGEKLPAISQQNFTIVNGYGPTEFTVCSHYHIVESEELEIPIGRPVPNSFCFVVDKNKQLVSQGIAGELCLAGTQISRGYWQRPELTAEKFVDCPFLQGEKMYHTGDLVRWNENGELEYLGRIDTQVKLRGFRIELGEIETKISAFSDISSAVVEVKEIAGTQHLVAYYSANSPIDTEALKAVLSDSLAEYMVPSIFMQLDALPLTPNGKVNRKALPLPEATNSSEYIAPTNETEATICDVFTKLLKIEQVGITDNFFDIGGTSLNAIKAVIAISNAGYSIQYGDLFKLKTPQAIAKFLLGGAEEETISDDKFNFAKYDYVHINKVLEQNKIEYDTELPSRNFNTVLLTGATGYLGIHLLRELIQSEVKQIFCLVRSSEELSAETRLKNMLMYYFGDTFEAEFEQKRLIIIDGDITDKKVIDSLKKYTFDAVINSAAMVKHYIADDEMERINVQGVNNLIDFCITQNSLLVHISTYSITGVKITSEYWELFENQLYAGQQTDNEYIRTKFLAERNIIEAIGQSGLNAKIMRVGNLMGRESDGEFQANFHSNAFISRLKSYKVMKCYPIEQMIAPIEISPIDRVAEAILLLSRTPNNLCVFHPFNNYYINMAVLIKAMNEYGFQIDVVSYPDFKANYDKTMLNADKSLYLQGLIHGGAAGDGKWTIGEANNNWTTTLLYKLGFHWSLTNVDYAKQLIKMLDGLGFFDE